MSALKNKLSRSFGLSYCHLPRKRIFHAYAIAYVAAPADFETKRVRLYRRESTAPFDRILAVLRVSACLLRIQSSCQTISWISPDSQPANPKRHFFIPTVMATHTKSSDCDSEGERSLKLKLLFDACISCVHLWIDCLDTALAELRSHYRVGNMFIKQPSVEY